VSGGMICGEGVVVSFLGRVVVEGSLGEMWVEQLNILVVRGIPSMRCVQWSPVPGLD
jgi:hypothetical protein